MGLEMYQGRSLEPNPHTDGLIADQLRYHGVGRSTSGWKFVSHLSMHPDLETSLKGETVIDLGCGHPKRSVAHVAGIMESLGATTYVGNDAAGYGLSDSPDPTKDVAPRYLKEKFAPMEVHLVHADMIDFLRTLKEGSVNICLNNIDSSVIKSEEYAMVAAFFIERATKPGGVVFGANSEPLKYMEELGFEKDRIFSDANSGIYKKPNHNL